MTKACATPHSNTACDSDEDVRKSQCNGSRTTTARVSYKCVPTFRFETPPRLRSVPTDMFGHTAGSEPGASVNSAPLHSRLESSDPRNREVCRNLGGDVDVLSRAVLGDGHSRGVDVLPLAAYDAGGVCGDVAALSRAVQSTISANEIVSCHQADVCSQGISNRLPKLAAPLQPCRPPRPSSQSNTSFRQLHVDNDALGRGCSNREDFITASSLPVHPGILEAMAQAFDGDVTTLDSSPVGATGFCWSGAVDAARAAWIGGTWLLKYGELLPGGLVKLLAFFDGPKEQRDVFQTSEAAASDQFVLELGMGRGRLALQLFLSGATVIGVELAGERFGMAVSAAERLAHRLPEDFEISRRSSDAVRIKRQDSPKGSLCEIRLGNFFNSLRKQEVQAATMVVCQVFLPPPTWSRVRELLDQTRPGCRLVMYEDLRRVWEGTGQACPFVHIGSPLLSCSWAPEKGHRFHCYERRDGHCVPERWHAGTEHQTRVEND